MYRLSESQEDRIGFDECVRNYARDAFDAVTGMGISLEFDEDLLDVHRDLFLTDVEVDDLEEAEARFNDAFRTTWEEEYEDFINGILFELEINRAQLNAMYVAVPVDGWDGKDVAERIKKRFDLDPEDTRPLGEQLLEAGVLTAAQARWFDS